MLEKQSPDDLVAFLEKFVGMLRNQPTASNIDVELYFKDANKLALKLEKIDATTLSFNVISAHKDAFNTMDHKMQAYEKLFGNLFRWAKAFSDFAYATLLVVQVQNEITELEEQVNQLNIKKNRANTVLSVMNEVNISEKLDHLVQSQANRLNLFNEIVATDEQQARDG